VTGTITKQSDLGEKDARSQRYPRFAGEAFEKNQRLVERVRAIAERRGVKAGQLALAWVLTKGDDVVPIPGTKRRKYREENAAAAAEIRLTPDEVVELEAAVPHEEIVGNRYAAANMKSIDR
jgi:aryl-alcohol dehydrogenase-like predicted oxidoreductase